MRFAFHYSEPHEKIPKTKIAGKLIKQQKLNASRKDKKRVEFCIKISNRLI